MRWCGCCGRAATTTVSQSRHGASALSIILTQYLHTLPCCMAAVRTLSLYLDLNICAAKIVCRHQEQVNVWAGLCILISKAVIMVTSHTQLSTNQSRGRWSGDQLWTNHRPALLQQTGLLLAGAEVTAASSRRLNNFNNFTLYFKYFHFFTLHLFHRCVYLFPESWFTADRCSICC